MRDNRHVSDVCWTVHQLTDLVYREVDHGGGGGSERAFEAGVRWNKGCRFAKS
jgi:hypothetical protein